MTIQAVLFDLDGTLADTALDLGAALNRLLIKKGLPEKSMAEIRPIASHGADALIELGANIDKTHPEHPQWRKAYLQEYAQGYADKTVLFNGVNQLIGSLLEQNLVWGIITNKPKQFTDKLIPKLHFIKAPAVVVSGDTTSEAKPSTKPMLYACDQINIKPCHCVYVGDALRDIEAGNNAGMKTILANWGYIAPSDKAHLWPYDAIVQQPLDILKILQND